MIDWDRVNELRDEVGADEFEEVVEIFLEELSEGMERLRAGLPPGSYESELHFLKGGALNLGFAGLAEVCGAGEKMAREGDADAVDLSAVLKAYEESLRAFAEMRKDMAA